ncbi:hypothetical protein GH714_032795 [Hevea brasiliensis]|uniref:Uncharacterized protein n=1 Tax=Hevea brasiliensis TaxID=3981 RepID=A0A6A6LL06_HEVBR|nr:hypothetical protein GH714_032795 [Hevea brasiliensis]
MAKKGKFPGDVCSLDGAMVRMVSAVYGVGLSVMSGGGESVGGVVWELSMAVNLEEMGLEATSIQDPKGVMPLSTVSTFDE